jgi:UDP-GlcNAc:undecaprenyl-phosphate/decaprenyl-phosphate GlcNAc-1-phosphate transferase
MLYKITILLCLTANILFILKFNTIASIINLFDLPDNKRKLHKDKVALLGGLIIFLSLIIFSINLLQNDTNFLNIFDFTKKNFFLLLIFSSLMFLFGFYDDKKSLNPNLKLFLVFMLILFYTFFDNSSLLLDLKFSFIEKTISLRFMSIPVTILCYLLFINAFNMFDGINLQCGIYSLSIILFLLLFNTFSNFLLFLLIPLVTFIILNLKNKCFLGDNGSMFLSFIFSALMIKSYNTQTTLIFADQIFLVMMIPGLELLRLAIFRIYKKKHPFKADRNHIHHYLLNSMNFWKTTFLIQSIIIIPVILNIIFGKTLFIIIINFIIYLFLIKKFSSK